MGGTIMLVLSRRIREELLIFPDGIDGRIIRVSISAVLSHNRVSLGCEAPREVLFLKGETYQKYLDEKSARSDKDSNPSDVRELKDSKESKS
jgi:carbon storage regulator CsrA